MGIFRDTLFDPFLPIKLVVVKNENVSFNTKSHDVKIHKSDGSMLDLRKTLDLADSLKTEGDHTKRYEIDVPSRNGSL